MFLEAMGRKAGWLALASFSGEPDFIIIPEAGLNYDDFLDKLMSRYKKRGHAVVVVAEGARYEGSDAPICEHAGRTDSFGHKRLGGVSEILAKRVKQDTGIENCNYTEPGYLYRSGNPIFFDSYHANLLGSAAAKSVIDHKTGNVAVLERQGKELAAAIRPISEVLLADSSGRIIPRAVDPRFYDPRKYAITEEGREYFRPISEWQKK